MSKGNEGRIAELEREMKDARVEMGKCAEEIERQKELNRQAYRKYWKCNLELIDLQENAN